MGPSWTALRFVTRACIPALKAVRPSARPALAFCTRTTSTATVTTTAALERLSGLRPTIEADVSTEISILHESNIKAKRARLGSVLLEPEPYDTAFGHYLHDPSMDDEGEGGFADDEGDGAVLENTARGPSLLQQDQEAGSSDEPTGGQPSKESKSKRDRHKRPVDSTGYRAA